MMDITLKIKAMKKIIVFVSILFSVVKIEAQGNIYGVYNNETDSLCKIEISKDRFYYIESLPIWANDTLAECMWRRVSEQFIEIKYPYPSERYKILENTEKIQSWDTTRFMKKRIKFRFSIPYVVKPIRISVFNSENHNDSVEFVYSESQNEVIFPNRMEKFDLAITQDGFNMPLHDKMGLFYGVGAYWDFENEIVPDANLINIHIPLDDSFFEKYYILKGEFVRVNNDTITWKGRNFIKK